MWNGDCGADFLMKGLCYKTRILFATVASFCMRGFPGEKPPGKSAKRASQLPVTRSAGAHVRV